MRGSPQKFEDVNFYSLPLRLYNKVEETWVSETWVSEWVLRVLWKFPFLSTHILFYKKLGSQNKYWVSYENVLFSSTQFP